jgi:hypothetical protein
MTKTVKKKTTSDSSGLLKEFLGEAVIVVMTGMDAEVVHEDGSAIMPTAVEGILWDYDKNFIMLGDEYKTTFSLLSLKHIGKIDMSDAVEVVGSKSDPRNMN